ncbi:hypothetical protein ACJJV6_10750 [Arthrobacter nitrophenolicus]|uniref:hypothetical protein n=1 Tax=Arthrobacter nitrophenolicus TaxID=683150 RepID=UPI003899B313
MDRALNALVNLDVPADTVRIDVRGSLNHESRPDLVHIIRRVRRMGIRSHIRVDLSQAALVESAALAGLRSDLNAMDITALAGIDGAGVSLQISTSTGSWTSPGSPAGRTVPASDDDALLPDVSREFLGVPAARLEDLFSRPLQEYSGEELLAASDTLFALLDNPRALAGSDLLGRYNDIGREILRRRQDPEAPSTAAEGQTAS